MDIPVNLKHKPVVAVEYETIDSEANAGDAMFLSIGKATWDNSVFSVKVWRQLKNGSWSRQSEDLPLWRLLDMTILLISQIMNKQCSLNPEILKPDELKSLHSYLKDLNKDGYIDRRIDEIKSLLTQ